MYNKHKDHGGRSRKGQSTVEYIVLVTAVLSVAILFMTNRQTGFQQKLNATMSDVTDTMGTMSDRLTSSTASSSSNGTAPTAPITTPVTANVIH